MFGVAVPCYKYHIPLLKRLFDSIENQTVKPDIVCVSCSSSNNSDIPTYNYSFPINFIIEEKRQNASVNRNIASKTLINKGCEYISFFDADDVMHPQRIEAIKKAFEHPVKIVLHNYLDDINEFIKYENFNFIWNELIKAPSGCAIVKSEWRKRIHHAQVSVHKNIMNLVTFREEKIYERREDSLFCGDVLKILNGNENCYICNPLSKYYPEGVWY